jgi:hypothetical protein
MNYEVACMNYDRNNFMTAAYEPLQREREERHDKVNAQQQNTDGQQHADFIYACIQNW